MPAAIYDDAETIASIEADILAGCSFTAAFGARGFDRSLFSKWLKRANEEGAEPALVEAVNQLARARETAILHAERRVYTGGPDFRGPLAWLERMDRETWGKAVRVEMTGPDGDADAAALWAKIQAAAASSSSK